MPSTKPFAALVAKMSPESRLRVETKAQTIREAVVADARCEVCEVCDGTGSVTVCDTCAEYGDDCTCDVHDAMFDVCPMCEGTGVVSVGGMGREFDDIRK